ncbi:MAG: adenylosuccinate lyase [Candidatus Eisenbacteria bacterium]|nr:adenylosuccinate lyase [Candidatus Eisenbacteria bacterium]
MISRYTRPYMAELWDDRSRFGVWLEVELAHLETLENHGIAPKGSTERARSKATFDVARIDELERELHHDVVAFLTNVGESLAEDKTYLHYGMTSSDLVDTALAIQIQRAQPPIMETIGAIGARLHQLALEHRNTVCVGRTHGVHAEPTSFGLKMLGWYSEMGRQHARLAEAFAQCRYGKISGAVGTAAHLPPAMEEETLGRLGLGAEPIATQVVPRDRLSALLSAVAGLGATLERFAVEIRHLQRSEVREAEEPFGRGQKGSSAMPHKRNPILCERVTGLARVLRGNAHAAMENVALWHERDISHSSVERVIVPDSLTLVDYVLDKFHFVIAGLRVFPERMRQNLESTGGLVYSQRVLLALTEACESREVAYRIVQMHAMRTWEQGGRFQDRLAEDPEVTQHLTGDEVAALFDPNHYLRNLDAIYGRVLKTQWEGANA